LPGWQWELVERIIEHLRDHPTPPKARRVRRKQRPRKDDWSARRARYLAETGRLAPKEQTHG
jgi:hypothetical protein